VIRDSGRIRRVSLTGGIATGKSYVRARLEGADVPTIDADALARDVVVPGTPGYTAVIERFGPGVVALDGQLDRRALGAIVFADRNARYALESIVHPAVRKAIDEWFTSLDPTKHRFAVADIPLLFETGRERDFDAVILTVCSVEVQIERLRLRDGMTDAEARQRIAAQLPAEQKLPRATFIINTDGSFDDTDRQVEHVVRELNRQR
jgi:dephospho-CoA kinase